MKETAGFFCIFVFLPKKWLSVLAITTSNPTQTQSEFKLDLTWT